MAWLHEYSVHMLFVVPYRLLYLNLKLSSESFSILAASGGFWKTLSLEAKGRRGRKQRGPL
jgi:hypothetical protein